MDKEQLNKIKKHLELPSLKLRQTLRKCSTITDTICTLDDLISLDNIYLGIKVLCHKGVNQMAAFYAATIVRSLGIKFRCGIFEQEFSKVNVLTFLGTVLDRIYVLNYSTSLDEEMIAYSIAQKSFRSELACSLSNNRMYFINGDYGFQVITGVNIGSPKPFLVCFKSPSDILLNKSEFFKDGAWRSSELDYATNIEKIPSTIFYGFEYPKIGIYKIFDNHREVRFNDQLRLYTIGKGSEPEKLSSKQVKELLNGS